MTTITLTDPALAANISRIHLGAFPNFFLTFLGNGFLKCFYKGFITHDSSSIIGAFDDSDILIGFVAYSENISQFYKYLLKKNVIQLVWYSAAASIRKPTAVFRLFRALTYSEKSFRDEPYIKLQSIGVLPEACNQGAGTLLINAMMNEIKLKQFTYVELETDKFNNEATNKFYVRNGFRLFRSFVTPEGREMNVYRFELH